jgi:hypothetical protein
MVTSRPRHPQVVNLTSPQRRAQSVVWSKGKSTLIVAKQVVSFNELTTDFYNYPTINTILVSPPSNYPLTCVHAVMRAMLL